MSDSRIVKRGKTILNFLLNYDGEQCLLNPSMYPHMIRMQHYYGFIQEIGPQHFIQVIMDNIANYVFASSLSMQRYPPLFWIFLVPLIVLICIFKSTIIFPNIFQISFFLVLGDIFP